MSRSQRGGFTLIELLVVITIIGMLMALLIPAANAVRATMQRLNCASNQRQIGIALLQVANQNNQQLPGYRNVLKPDPTDSTKSIVGGWPIVILPGLQQKQLYDQFRDDPTKVAKIPYLEILVCPSDPPENNLTPASDYVVNCGKPDILGGDKAANGLFFDKAPAGGASTKTINSTLAKIPDGAENTLMVSENMNLVKLIDAAKGWGDTGTQSDRTKVTEPRLGFVWWDDNKQSDGSPSPYRKINGGRISDPSLPTPTASDYARPASNHNGGVNVCFASGRETWLREDIAYWVYQQLMTPDGDNATPLAHDESGTAYRLSDGDH